MAKLNDELKELRKELNSLSSAKLCDETFRIRVIESSVELRELESKLKEAYVLKERHKQLTEQEIAKQKEKELLLREKVEDELRIAKEREMESRKRIHERLKKEEYCAALLHQAEETRLMKKNEEQVEREIEQEYIQHAIWQQVERENRERIENEIKKQRLAIELQNCIQMQKQWQQIQKLIELEEDRLIEECVAHRNKLSQMQQQERREKAAALSSIRQQLLKTLEMEERRRKEREELWVELACLEQEQEAEKKLEEINQQECIKKEILKNQMEEQMRDWERRKAQEKEEKNFERLMILKQSLAQERAEMGAAEEKRKLKDLFRREQEELLEQRKVVKAQEQQEKIKERLQMEEKQRLEDQAIADERRRILEQNAPLLMGFLPPGIFRNLDEVKSLPPEIQEQFKARVRIQDDPDLW